MDVKLRSSQVRAARIRMAAIALGFVFASVLGVYLVWRTAEMALDRLVYENKTFAIRTLDIQTDGQIAVDQLRRWAGVKIGQNMFALDLRRVQRDLELISVIQLASVERIMPSTLRIRVVEREPLGQINVPRARPGGGLDLAVFHIDAAGYVMTPLEPKQRATVAVEPYADLPVISGLNFAEVQPGRRLEHPQVQAALQLILSFERSSLAGLTDLKRIDVSSPGVLVATNGHGSEITFGLSDMDQQMRRWRDIFEASQKLGKGVASLDLAITNHIPLRWLEASVVPPVNPKPVKPQRNRKKNV